MATKVLMPQLGESITEGTIVRWNKNIGDHVDRDEPLFEVSTDKVDAEVPAPAPGLVTEVLAQVGDTVPVDSVVAVIGTEDAPHGGSSGDDPPPSAGRSAGSPTPPPAEMPPSRRGRLSPLVRKLARENGIDPNAVVGTGTGGRVTRDDLLRHAAQPRDGARVEPLSPMRISISEHMVLSRRTSAHVHTVFDVDFTVVEALRRKHRDAYARQGATLTYLSFIAKAVVEALTEMPFVNAELTRDGKAVALKPTVNLGIAVALDPTEPAADAGGGLIVPVIKDASRQTVLELSWRIDDLATRARARKLVPDDVRQGTFTITNPGAFGSIFGLPIINQPQVAILCVGAVERRPVVVDDEGTIEARLRSYLTLGFDHRLIDGAVADRFMARVKAGLEQFDGGSL